MGRFDPDSPYRMTVDPVVPKKTDTDHCRLAKPLMGPQDETLDRLMGRTEAELQSVDVRRRQSLLARVRAVYAARGPLPTR